jgi:hypothetical protein
MLCCTAVGILSPFCVPNLGHLDGIKQEEVGSWVSDFLPSLDSSCGCYRQPRIRSKVRHDTTA